VPAEQKSNPINRAIASLTGKKSQRLLKQQMPKELKEWKNFGYHIFRLRSAKSQHQSMLFIDLAKIPEAARKAINYSAPS
jgi:hypothetical protein